MTTFQTTTERQTNLAYGNLGVLLTIITILTYLSLFDVFNV